jgi:hypothetical protein
MPSGLLFIVILAIWAVILIPRVIRMYDQHATHRSTRRFRHAMASLGGSRRSRRPVDVMMVRRAQSVQGMAAGILLDPAVDLHLDHGVDPFVTDAALDEAETSRRVEARREALRRAAARRRRVVLALAAAAIACVGLGVAGFIPLLAAVIPGFLTLGMVLVSRRFARQQAAWREQVRHRAEQRRADRASDVIPLAPVVSVRRRIDDHGAAVPGRQGASSAQDAQGGGFSWMSGAGRVATPAQLRLMEQYRALSATYSDPEEELGLDDYVSGANQTPAAGYRRLRAVNE